MPHQKSEGTSLMTQKLIFEALYALNIVGDV